MRPFSCQYSLLDKIILNISDQSDTLAGSKETCDNERLYGIPIYRETVRLRSNIVSLTVKA